jgi:hypothetical protein
MAMPTLGLACPLASSASRLACKRKHQCRNSVDVVRHSRGKDTTVRTLFLTTTAFAALAIIAPIDKAHADTPHQAMLKSIADPAAFGRVVFETIKKVTALNHPDAIYTACNPDGAPAYCETTYELGDSQDKLEALVDVDSSGKVEKTLMVYKHGAELVPIP